MIIIKSIEASEMRYPTVGDYWYDDNGDLQVRVVKMDKKSEMLVILHELVEQFITEQRGISEGEILKFDMEYERNRRDGDESEPGDAEDAPYRKEHRFAENIERLIAHEIGIDFNEYNKF